MRIKIQKNEVGVYALGGLGEIGKNTYGIEYQNEIILIDAGIKFPEDDLLGIDYVIPDYSYIVKNIDRIKGLFITHGHEDHIGGVPFLLKMANIPIYAGPFALALIRNKLEEHGLLKSTTLREINDDSVIKFDNLTVSFYRVTHSIPDAYGIVINTPNGNIVTTGDFKFDFTPVGMPADFHRIAKIGEEGVLLLLSDSTNATVPGFTKSEKIIGASILNIFKKCEGRIIFASFASNVYRLQQAARAAHACGRKIAVFGRSMENAIEQGLKMGYIDVPDGTFIEVSELRKCKDQDVVIMCTGSQGEPNAALSRVANGNHRFITIQPNDTVIFSSSPIPGNTSSVTKLINQLSIAGAEVIHGKINNIHTSGHAGQDEQKLMFNLISPKYFMPVHGEFKMQKVHAMTAEEVGIPKDNIFMMRNGDVLALTPENARLAGHIDAGDVYVDGNGVGDIGNLVLRDRRILSEEGLVLAFATIDIERRQILSGPDIQSRGFVYMKESMEMMKQAQYVLFEALKEALAGTDELSEADLRDAMTRALQPFLYEQTRRHPVVLSTVLIPDTQRTRNPQYGQKTKNIKISPVKKPANIEAEFKPEKKTGPKKPSEPKKTKPANTVKPTELERPGKVEAAFKPEKKETRSKKPRKIFAKPKKD